MKSTIPKRPQVLVLRDVPPPYGGVRVSSTLITGFLTSKEDINYVALDFDNAAGPIAKTIFDYIAELKRSQAVVFQIGDIFTMSRKKVALYLILALVFRCPIIYRGFGGVSKIAEMTPRSSLNFWRFFRDRLALVTFETKQDIAYFKPETKTAKLRCEWFPNAPCSKPAKSLEPRGEARKFCFFGRISKAKGVDLILEAAKDLPYPITIDFYGEFDHDYYKAYFSDHAGDSRLAYRGTVAPQDLDRTLRQYDCLLLPTTWRTEGYPGVILEALSVGVPVIATRWNAIPEIVDSSCGMLVKPDSVDDLKQAIITMHLDRGMWNDMRSGAVRRIHEEFNAMKWADRMHDWIRNIVIEEPVSIGLKSNLSKKQVEA